MKSRLCLFDLVIKVSHSVLLVETRCVETKNRRVARLEKKNKCAQFMIRNCGHHRWITKNRNITTVVSLVSTTVLLIKTIEDLSRYVDFFKRTRKNLRFVRREVVPQLENAFVQFKRRWNSRVSSSWRFPKRKRRRKFRRAPAHR